MAHYRITEGKPVTGPRQIAIGRRAADSLKKGIGSTLRLFGVPYEIVGIYETGQAMEESGGTVVLEDAQTITQKTRKVSLFQVGVRKGTDLSQVMARIEALEKDLAVSKSSEYDASEQWSQYLQGFAWGIAAIAILIGGLGMMNAMVMSVLERTREIGTLRAVGWSRRRVVTLILGETVVLSLIGGLVGIALGVGLTELAATRARDRRHDGRRLLDRHFHPGPGDCLVSGRVGRRLSGLGGGESAAGRGAALRGRRFG